MNNFRSRLITENLELREKTGKLRFFIHSKAIRDLDKREQELLIEQEEHMSKYLDILEERLARS